MASVTFPPEVGGSGLTVTDDANPTTGLANGGHRKRFVPALSQVVAVASNTVTKAAEAVASAEAASDWATKTDGPVSGGEYSAKYHAAAAAVSAAAAQAVVLNGAAIVPTWLTGTTWALGQLVLSGINGKTYRKITATSMTTIDPASDATNWAALPVPAQTAAQTEFTPIGGVSAANVQGAIEELDSEKSSKTGAEALTNKTLVSPVLNLGGTDGLPGQFPISQGAGQPIVWHTMPTVIEQPLSLRSMHTTSASIVIPANVSKIRAYVVGRGGDAVTNTYSGGGGGFAFGDIAVTSGETLTVNVTAGVAKLLRGSTVLLQANAASGATAGTATKDASVTSGGAYSGGAGSVGTGGRGGASAGSPLGNGIAASGGSSGYGGSGINGAGAFNGGSGGGGGGNDPRPRSLPYYTDPLIAHCYGAAGNGATGQNGQHGGGGGYGSGSSPAGNGGFGAGGGGQTGIGSVAGHGGALGGGGGSTGPYGGDGGFGGGGGSATTGGGSSGLGGPACVWIYY